MLVSRTPVWQTVFLTPVIFGLAHVHHFYEFRLTNPQVPVLDALLRSCFQMAYTTLFGAYATFIYMRTGSLLAVCAIHAFCNSMGLPRLWGMVRPSSLAGGRILETGNLETVEKGALQWTIGYYVLLVVGAVLWWKNLWLLTEGENALVATEAFTKP
jgi:prenyl protein peptidase